MPDDPEHRVAALLNGLGHREVRRTVRPLRQDQRPAAGRRAWTWCSPNAVSWSPAWTCPASRSPCSGWTTNWKHSGRRPRTRPPTARAASARQPDPRGPSTKWTSTPDPSLESDALISAAPTGVRLFRAVGELLTAAEQEPRRPRRDGRRRRPRHRHAQRGAHAAARAADRSAAAATASPPSPARPAKPGPNSRRNVRGPLGCGDLARSAALPAARRPTCRRPPSWSRGRRLLAIITGQGRTRRQDHGRRLCPFTAVSLRAGLATASPDMPGTAAAAASARRGRDGRAQPEAGRARPLAEKSLGHPDAGGRFPRLIVGTIGHSMMKEGTHG